MRVKAEYVVGALGVAGIIALVAIGSRYGKGKPAKKQAAEADGVTGRKEVVDTSYGFKLVPPGPEWQVFDRAETDDIWLGNVASMQGPAALVKIRVEQVGALELADAVRFLIANESGELLRRESIKYVGHDAFEVELDGSNGRVVFRAFVRDGLQYQVYVAEDGIDPTVRIDRDAIWRAFTLLDGPVAPVAIDRPPTDIEGPGWRVEGRRFVSAAAGIAIEERPGWRMHVGRRLLGSTAEVKLDNERFDATIWLSAWMPARRRAPPRDQALTLAVLGQERTFRRDESDAVSTYATVGLPLGPDRDLGVQLRYPRHRAAEALEAVQAQLAALVALDAGALARERQESAMRPNRQLLIGQELSLRAGRFMDHLHGIRWNVPPGMWRLATGKTATDMVQGAVVAATLPGVGVDIVIVPSIDLLDETIESFPAVAKTWGWKGIRAIEMEVKRRRVPAVEAYWTGEDVRYVHRIALLVEHGRAVALHLDGPKPLLDAHAATIKAALDAVSLDAPAATERTDKVYTDHRLGFSVNLPGWTLTQDWTYDRRAIRWWGKDDAAIGVEAAFWTGGTAASPVLQQRARMLSSWQVIHGEARRWHEDTARLAGWAAKRLTWQEGTIDVAAMLIDVDGIVYTVMTRGDEDTRELARRAFTLERPATP